MPSTSGVSVAAPEWPGVRASLRAFDHSIELAGVSRVVFHGPSRWDMEADGATCTVSIAAGMHAAFTLSTADTERRVFSIQVTVADWRRMIPEMHAERHTRINDAGGLLETTAAVLLGLRRRDGGIVAAPTTSLPQWPGSGRTWDYRYCWLRDLSLAALAMLRLGLLDSAQSLAAFIGNVVREFGPVPLVRLDGGSAPDETEMSELAGYGGARPVRIGNAAAAQAQLDVPGEVIELATSLAGISALPDELAAAVPLLADWLVQHWREPDHGIWEIRGSPARYSHSLVTAISGLEGAAALVDRRVVTGDAAAWRRAADAVATEPVPGTAHCSSTLTVVVPMRHSLRRCSSVGSTRSNRASDQRWIRSSKGSIAVDLSSP